MRTLKKEILKTETEYKKKVKTFKKYLKEYPENHEYYIKQYITPSNIEKQNKEKILKTFINRETKQKNSKILELKKIFEAGDIKNIKVIINWRKNKTWGLNPTAEAKIEGDFFENFKSSSIGGCGYDKESTAFAEALNKSFAFRKLLLKNSHKIKNLYGHSNGQLLGGVGISCYYKIFSALGFKMESIVNDKFINVFMIIKKIGD